MTTIENRGVMGVDRSSEPCVDLPLHIAARTTIPVNGATGIAISSFVLGAATWTSTVKVQRRTSLGGPAIDFATVRTLTSAAPLVTLEAADLVGVTEVEISANGQDPHLGLTLNIRIDTAPTAAP